MTYEIPRTPDEPIDFRSVGFTDLAANYPRDDLALAMLAAFNNVRVDQLPAAMRYFPNEATKAAWTRVAEAAVAHILRREDADTNEQQST